MKIIALIMAIALSAGVSAAQAQESPRPATSLGDEQVNKIIQLALDNLQRLRCENNQPCAPARPEERTSPPITTVEARAIIERGILSGAAQQCGLDWERLNFGPMMAYWRGAMKKNERQMALVALLHGIMQGMSGPRAGTTLQCNDEQRRNLESRLKFVP